MDPVRDGVRATCADWVTLWACWGLTSPVAPTNASRPHPGQRLAARLGAYEHLIFELAGLPLWHPRAVSRCTPQSWCSCLSRLAPVAPASLPATVVDPRRLARECARTALPDPKPTSQPARRSAPGPARNAIDSSGHQHAVGLLRPKTRPRSTPRGVQLRNASELDKLDALNHALRLMPDNGDGVTTQHVKGDGRSCLRGHTQLV